MCACIGETPSKSHDLLIEKYDKKQTIQQMTRLVVCCICGISSNNERYAINSLRFDVCWIDYLLYENLNDIDWMKIQQFII